MVSKFQLENIHLLNISWKSRQKFWKFSQTLQESIANRTCFGGCH